MLVQLKTRGTIEAEEKYLLILYQREHKQDLTKMKLRCTANSAIGINFIFEICMQEATRRFDCMQNWGAVFVFLNGAMLGFKLKNITFLGFGSDTRTCLRNSISRSVINWCINMHNRENFRSLGFHNMFNRWR